MALAWDRINPLKVVITFLFFGLTILANGCAGSSPSAEAEKSSGKKEVIRLSIGTQDQVINTAVGGATVRELKLLEKHLPTTGKYANVDYDIQWSSYTSGPPITNKMLAAQIDIGLLLLGKIMSLLGKMLSQVNQLKTPKWQHSYGFREKKL